jgi:hypothetical protein
MAVLADDELPSIQELAQYQRDGRAWVAPIAGDYFTRATKRARTRSGTTFRS